jgi:hypothetical protein
VVTVVTVVTVVVVLPTGRDEEGTDPVMDNELSRAGNGAGGNPATMAPTVAWASGTGNAGSAMPWRATLFEGPATPPASAARCFFVGRTGEVSSVLPGPVYDERRPALGGGLGASS